MRVREVTDDQLVPRPDHEAIQRWLTEEQESDPWGELAPEGMGAGHYQRLTLDLSSGELRFACWDWREPDAFPQTGPGGRSFLSLGWEVVPEVLVWTIWSGHRTSNGETPRPYLTAEQGNAIARAAAPTAQVLLDNLIEVPGTGEFDWSPEAANAAWDVYQLCQEDPQQRPRMRGVYASMAAAVEADPELVERRWADLDDAHLDEEAGHLTRMLGSTGWSAQHLPAALGIRLGDGEPFTVVGTRAWIYGYRAQMADGRTPMQLSTWWARSKRTSLVTPDDSEEHLVHLAAREQRAATEEGVLLVDPVEGLRAERARARARLVTGLRAELGPKRVDAKKRAKLAERAVRARLDQILLWEDPAHANFAQLGDSAGMSRQAVQARAARLKGGETPELIITCPRCHSQDTEEYAEPIRGTDDYAEAIRCLDCRAEWAHDPGADLACSRCGGSGRIGAGPSAVRVDGQWKTTPSCPCVRD
ncbi:hypothetical protein DR950_41755 [Kitasatospora xanthocidica]|uniref:Uncharacterized protein n=1 Tax=Kitasatospora xanthocidica TaxID=83382 RepID=A0A372ZI17_9ACTN|nr:hypothetical protein DR950_41755 [Kitasatospora xanthocidica]